MLLDNICKAYGIRVLTYQKNEKMLLELGLRERAKKAHGFAFYRRNIPTILFDGNMSALETNFIVAHELGHIMLGHVSFRKDYHISCTEAAEREADAFAVQLLARELDRQFGGPGNVSDSDTGMRWTQ